MLGSIKYFKGIYKVLFWTAFRILLPLSVKLFGYIHQSLIGTNIPRGISNEWIKWCNSPNYLFYFLNEGKYHYYYDKVKAPILSYSLERDNSFAPEAAVHVLHQHYKNVTHKFIKTPPLLGHFGYYKEKGTFLWDESIEWYKKAK